MNKWQKIGLGVFVVTSVAQAAAGMRILQRCEELEKQYERVRMAGIYALSILERENVNLNDFDELAFEALRPDPKEDSE